MAKVSQGKGEVNETSINHRPTPPALPEDRPEIKVIDRVGGLDNHDPYDERPRISLLHRHLIFLVTYRDSPILQCDICSQCFHCGAFFSALVLLP